MRSRLAVLITATGVISALMVASISVPGWAVASRTMPALRNEPAARGIVTDSKGNPLSGVRVILYAWPDSKVLSKLRPGDRVPVKRAGSAVTTASGRYAIRVTAPNALRAVAAPNGAVNLEVIAATSAGAGSFSFPRRIIRTGKGMALGSALSGKTPRAASAERADLHLLRLSRPEATALRSPRACGWAFLKSYGPEWTVVGATYSIVTGVTQHFTYSNGQSSSLGVGQSSSGKSGSFSESGTDSESSNTTEDYPTFSNKIAIEYKTQFVYGEYGYSCGSGFISYMAKPTSYAGGAEYSKTGSRVAEWCVWQNAGTTFTKSTTSAYTFSAGLSISAIGLTLTAQTGYDTGATISYHFTVRHLLCGRNDFPGGSPGLIQAGD